MMHRYATGIGPHHAGAFGPWIALMGLIVWLVVVTDLILLGLVLVNILRKKK